MASIKVTYGQTSHKFTIASNTTWTEFESKLHDLFNIPNNITISLVYVDEDGDVITLSTDSELQQILSDQELFGTNVKFNIYTSENPDSDGWVLENAEEKDDDSVTVLSDDESKVEHDETENQERQQPLVETDYPHATVTDEKDDPLFEQPASIEKNFEKQQEELLIPVNSEIKQNQGTSNEEYSSTEKAKENTTGNDSSNTVSNTEGNTDENVSNNNTENNNNSSSSSTENNNTENDSNIIFIISSSPWIQRTYYRPRVSPFASLLSHFIRPSYSGYSSYSYITPRPSYRRYRRRPCFGCESTHNNRYGLFI